MDKKLITVAQLSRLTGVSSKKIRYLDACGKLKPVQRTESGYRYYKQEQIPELLSLVGERVVIAYTVGKKRDNIEQLEEINKEFLRYIRAVEKTVTVIGVYENWTGDIKNSKMEEIIKQAVKGQVSKIYVFNEDSFIRGKWKEYKQWLGYMGTELIDFSTVDFTPEVINCKEIIL